MVNEQGIFIISLDFELNWGVHDVFTPEQYEENIIGVREAIPRILELFHEFDIHATWATVGMLFFESKEELIANSPALQPSYRDSSFSPYGKMNAVGANEVEDPYHFGASLIKEILKYPNQELASHTFSHYYCLEEGQTVLQFEADLQASLNVGIANGIPKKTLVFPRNQMNSSYLEVCKKYGIKGFRGNEESWLYEPSRFHREGFLKRIIRLSDSYLNVSGHHTYPIGKVKTDPIVNLPSSRFLRPYNTRLKVLEPLRLKRVKNSILNAAKKGEVYHLWWHPHNFGKNIDENIKFLAEILNKVSEVKTQYGFQSLNMGEASTLALQVVD